MFQTLEMLKPDIKDVMNRMDKMYHDALQKRGGNILFRVLPPSDIAVYSDIVVNSYQYDQESELDRYADDLCKAYLHSFEARIAIPDDAVPTVTPVLGIGDYSAFVAGDISFSTDTSWSTPCLENLGDWHELPPIGSSLWYHRFLTICEKILQNTEGTGIPFARGFFSPLDLAGALRGEKIYFDFYDDPDELHQLLDFCADATIRFTGDIYGLAGKYLSNTPYGTWYLDQSINMSEDIACMISPELYREFCAPHTQKVIDHFGKGFMHTHSRAPYLVREICGLKNVVNLWYATDPNQQVPVHHLEELVEDAQYACLAIDCTTFEEFESTVDLALKGNVSYCMPVKTLEEGIQVTNRANELLRRKGVR